MDKYKSITAMKSLLELVCAAFPNGYDIKGFLDIYKKERTRNNEYQSCYNSLKQYKNINWKAYANKYISKGDDSDVIRDFLDNGLFEGNSLFLSCYKNIYSANHKNLISIILINYNNGKYLHGCIRSALNQTLKNIEIIIVDDGSIDNSIEIIDYYAKKDDRIKKIIFNKNKSQHMARKAGVGIASGEYIMFLDSDDLLTHDACAIAYKYINLGYDIVTFDAHIIHDITYNYTIKRDISNFVNSGELKEYRGLEICEAMFRNNAPARTLWNKIYDASIVKNAFDEMEDGYYPVGQDIYEIAVIATRSKSMLKINNKLYKYRIGSGITSRYGTNEFAEGVLKSTYILTTLKRFLINNGFYHYYELLINNIYERFIDSFLNSIDDKNITSYFNSAVKQLGFNNLLNKLYCQDSRKLNLIAEKFYFYNKEIKNPIKIKKIGILYSQMVNGGAENVIREQINILLQNGYEIFLFLSSADKNDLKLPKTVNIYYFPKQSSDKRELDGLTSLYNALQKNKIDLILSHDAYGLSTLWHIIILKYLRIPFIIFPHSSYARRLCYPDDRMDFNLQISIFKCADKVAAISKNADIFYKNMGINSCYIPNPIRNIGVKSKKIQFEERQNNIIICQSVDNP